MATDNRVIVIGAGASGLMAANVLAASGKEVLLLEKKRQCGLKLRITGKGRCNLTNTAEKEEYLSHISNPKFFAKSYEKFDNQDLISFFERRYLKLKVERGSRVYPESDKALDVFLTLIKPLEDNPLVEIIKDCTVERILTKNNQVEAVDTSKCMFFAKKIILATGGCTYPSTGSEGDGLDMANLLGHRVIDPLPALVGLRTQNGYPSGLQGFEVKNCNVSISTRDKVVIASAFGDIYLDEYGLAGPVVLTLSRLIARRLDSGEQLFISVDYKPKISEERMLTEIKQIFQFRRTEEVGSVLRRWFAKQMIDEVCKTCKLNPKTMAKNLKDRDFNSILWYLKQRRMPIVGDMGWREAIITQGGVDLREINPQTLESKKVKGLFFCGEVMDLDADTGGYNLQIAFTTGVVAAQSTINQ